MDLLTQLLGYLCGRGRCFVVDGMALPVCQRCLGLYVAAAVTAEWVLVARLWRRGLPPPAVLAGHLLLLAGAILGGVHVLDSGSLWRVICGAATGHVAMLWLAVSAGHLWRAGQVAEAAPRRWRRRDSIPAVVIIILLVAAGAAAATVPALNRLGEGLPAAGDTAVAPWWAWGYWVWTILAAVGAAALGVAGVCVAAAVVRFAWRACRRRRRSVGPGG
jgi:uncharacterized membrane protein